jgi:hypothetical protein
VALKARPVRLVGLVVAAVLIDGTVLWTSWRSGALTGDPFMFWVTVVLVLALTCGGVAELGLRRWAQLREMSSVSARPMQWTVLGAGVFLVVSSAFVALVSVAAGRQAPWRGSVITGVALVAAAPAAATLIGISQVASSPVAPLGKAVERLRQLLGVSKGLLAPLGGLVTLCTVALAVGLLGTTVKSPTQSSSDIMLVIIFGAIGTGLIGLLYGMPYTALQHQGGALARQIAPIQDLSKPSAVRKALAERLLLEGQLGVGSTLLADLRSGIIIVTPLISAALTAFLGKGE